jgi:hypothetical protein
VPPPQLVVEYDLRHTNHLGRRQGKRRVFPLLSGVCGLALVESGGGEGERECCSSAMQRVFFCKREFTKSSF